MEVTQTQYHGGFFYIERIHKILMALNSITARRSNNAAQMAEDLRLNYNLLNDLFKELSPKMKDKYKEEHTEAANKLKDEFESAIKTYARNHTIPSGYEKRLDAWERELRAFAEKKGLLVPDKMSPADALGH